METSNVNILFNVSSNASLPQRWLLVERIDRTGLNSPYRSFRYRSIRRVSLFVCESFVERLWWVRDEACPRQG